MFKKISFLLLSVFSLAVIAASSYTPHFDLELPSDGDTAWGQAIRANFTTIDTQMYVNEQATQDHIDDTTDAHMATAIGATGGATLCTTADDVQEYLDCLEGNVGPIIGGTVMTTNTAQTVTGVKTFSALPLMPSLGVGVLHSDFDGNLTSSQIVNADVSSGAAIDFSKLGTLTAGNILLGNASNVATSTAVTGDIGITDSGVTSISSGVIVNADVNASAAIDYSKLAALPSANILVGSAGNVATATAVTGDVGITNAGVTSITAGSIVNADVNASAAIDYSKLAALPSANILVGSAGNVATATAVTGDIGITNGGVTSITAGSIVNADVNASAAIAFSKLATLTSGNILVGSAGNVPTAVAMSGDATIIASGALTVANDAVSNAKMANMAQSTIKGRAVSAGTGDPTDLTATQATAILDAMVGDSGSGGTKGLVPAPAAGDATRFLRGDGTFAAPSVVTPASVQQVYTTSGANTYDHTVYFVISTGSATAGATYTNNGVTFTVVDTVASGTSIYMTGNNNPAASGTLTKASGTGDATLTFSSFKVPLYLQITAIGGGGGGGGGGTTAGTASGNGGNTTFNTTTLVANGGTGGAPGSGTTLGGAGGTGSSTLTGAALIAGSSGGTGIVSTQTTASYPNGGNGGVSSIGGSGYGGSQGIGGSAAVANSGSGGGGGSANGITVNGGGGGGGGAGATVHAILRNPSTTYSMNVGSAGTAGGAGTTGTAGGAGGTGRIIVQEFFQ